MKRAYIFLLLIAVIVLFLSPQGVDAVEHDFVFKAGLDGGYFMIDMDPWEKPLGKLTKPGFSLAGEYINDLEVKTAELGVGIEHLLARRTLTENGEEFGFTSFYSVLNFELGDIGSLDFLTFKEPFLRFRLGYNFFHPPASREESEDISTSNGLFAGGSLGAKKEQFLVECFFNLNTASETDEIYQETANISLFRIGVAVGLVI